MAASGGVGDGGEGVAAEAEAGGLVVGVAGAHRVVALVGANERLVSFLLSLLHWYVDDKQV